MKFENLDINMFLKNYINGTENYINDNIKVFIVNDNKSLSEVKCIDDMGTLIFDNALYLPFVNGFGTYVKCINGSEFDLDEGLEPEWIEGIGYVDTSSRLIDTGDFVISDKNIPGMLIRKDIEGYEILYAQHLLGSSKFEIIDKAGLLGIEMNEFINRNLI